MLPSDIFIHRNVFNGEKDFGVPKNRINEFVRVVHESQIY